MGLVGVTYALDEPSVGLHPADHDRLLSVVKGLRDRGNTVVVVEHDADTLLSCDHLIEVGPCLLYTSPSPRDATLSRMPSSA